MWRVRATSGNFFLLLPLPYPPPGADRHRKRYVDPHPRGGSPGGATGGGTGGGEGGGGKVDGVTGGRKNEENHPA